MGTYSEIINEIQKINQSFLENEFMITFCGIFSSGKSSLINCLLDYDEFKLPTGINPLTKLVTKIRYGKDLKLYYISNGNRIYLQKNKFEDLVTGISVMPNDCKEIIVEVPSEILKNGVVMLDTPGFEDEMGGELEKISRDAIARADIVVICTSAIYFGNMLEQDLVAEIGKSHGDFIIAVNRMDGINSQKDMQSIRRRAENFVKNNNSCIISNSMGRNLFFTTADGKFKDLDGLDSSLAYILSNNSIMSDIKQRVFANKMSDALEKLSSQVILSTEKKREELKSVQEKNTQKRKELKHQLIIENSKNQTKKDVQINRYKVKMNTHLDKVYKYINQLEKDGKCQNFSCEAKKLLMTQMEYLVSDIRADFCRDYHTLELINYFNRIVGNFTIPKPVEKRVKKSVKKRGILGNLKKIAESAVDWMLSLDNGYELICENYAPTAIKAIESELKPKLQIVIEQIISYRYAPKSEETIETGYEKGINEIEEEIQNLLSVEEQLKYYNIIRLAKVVRSAKLKKAQFRIDFIGEFGSGKSTLINALIRKDLLVTNFYPQAALVTKLVFKADEKAIIYKNNIDETTGKQITQEMSIEKFFEKPPFNRDIEDMFTDIDYIQLQLSETGPFNGMVEIFDHPSIAFLKAKNDIIISKKSDAIICVLDALNLYLFDIIEYIRAHFAGENPKNLFFAINRFDQILPDEIDEIKRYTENILKAIFTKKDGTFDRELFESRVFYTNAFGSLNTRTGNPTRIHGVEVRTIPDENTGVPELEDALDRYIKTIVNK